MPAASAASQKRRRATTDAELETDLLETEAAVSDQQVHDRLGQYLADVKGGKRPPGLELRLKCVPLTVFCFIEFPLQLRYHFHLKMLLRVAIISDDRSYVSFGMPTDLLNPAITRQHIPIKH